MHRHPGSAHRLLARLALSRGAATATAILTLAAGIWAVEIRDPGPREACRRAPWNAGVSTFPAERLTSLCLALAAPVGVTLPNDPVVALARERMATYQEILRTIARARGGHAPTEAGRYLIAHRLDLFGLADLLLGQQVSTVPAGTPPGTMLPTLPD